MENIILNPVNDEELEQNIKILREMLNKTSESLHFLPEDLIYVEDAEECTRGWMECFEHKYMLSIERKLDFLYSGDDNLYPKDKNVIRDIMDDLVLPTMKLLGKN